LTTILSLHFGHDAAACVLSDGKITGYALRERHSRVKHALGLTTDILDHAMREAGLAVGDIDAIAITSTQSVELMTGLLDSFDVTFCPHDAHGFPSPTVDALQSSGHRIEDLLLHEVEQAFRSAEKSHHATAYRHLFPEGHGIDWDSFETVGWLDNYLAPEIWKTPAGLDDLAKRSVELNESSRFGFHFPVAVTWRNHEIPGYFVNHHMAHAASCYYRSGFTRAAVLSHDGFSSGESYHGGIFGFGDGNRLWPVAPHHLTIGVMYDLVAASLNLGAVGGPGKLMGLAPYGKPVMFDTRFVCNEATAHQRFGSELAAAWISHCAEFIKSGNYDTSSFGSLDAMTAAVNVDLAASTQKVFEEIYLAAVRALGQMLENAAIECGNLCLTGGTALNCPSNSRVATEGPFANLFIEPSCDDGGLCIGAGLHLFHNLMEQPVEAPKPYCSPYLGGRFSRDEVEQAIHSVGADINVSEPDDAAREAAQDILEDRVIAWFEGRSETGPRALGHRSILANPTRKANWQRVNELKLREPWRPFAPAVLEEAAADWFDGCPLPSPYMLFTAQVMSPELPAITHVDGSSRIQTVDPSCGRFFDLLTAFADLSGIPVVMNTSFNGPGEPIVETPEQAIQFLLSTNIDAIYLEGLRVTANRRESAPKTVADQTS